MNPVPGAIYRHYKSKGDFDHVYRIVSIAKHSESGEDLVIYEPLYENEWLDNSPSISFARPLSMFIEKVDVDGKTLDRFQLVYSPKK